MNIEKSKSIRAGLQKGFRDGTSQMAQRKCYGYDTGPDSELVINPDEATVVRWIFERYLSGDSLGKIAAGLEGQGIPSPMGKSKWNREALNKLLSNEKYTGRVLLQKPLVLAAPKSKAMASWVDISTPLLMKPLFLMRHSRQFKKKRRDALSTQRKDFPYRWISNLQAAKNIAYLQI